jgi:hypothetical protein
MLVTMARSISRGMLQVRGVTYRIERTEPHCYCVVRLLDDVEVGTFRTRPAVRVHPQLIDAELMRDVVRAAMRSARTSAVMQVAPAFQPDDESTAAASSAPPTRSSSSTPPPDRAMA